MSDFHPFQEAVKKQFEKMTKDNTQLYTTSIDSNVIWLAYLEAFPEGTNEIYKERSSDHDGRVRASFNIIYLNGWKAHDSQQKPLKPGSAKQRLADALNVDEIKIRK